MQVIDFSQIFDTEDLAKGIKYKLINHSKNTSYSGVLDMLGRTIRVFDNDQDDVEAIIVGHDNSDELIMYEVQESSSSLTSDEVCCACEAEDLDVGDNNLDVEDDLEEDYHDFGN